MAWMVSRTASPSPSGSPMSSKTAAKLAVLTCVSASWPVETAATKNPSCSSRSCNAVRMSGSSSTIRTACRAVCEFICRPSRGRRVGRVCDGRSGGIEASTLFEKMKYPIHERITPRTIVSQSRFVPVPQPGGRFHCWGARHGDARSSTDRLIWVARPGAPSFASGMDPGAMFPCRRARRGGPQRSARRVSGQGSNRPHRVADRRDHQGD